MRAGARFPSRHVARQSARSAVSPRRCVEISTGTKKNNFYESCSIYLRLSIKIISTKLIVFMNSNLSTKYTRVRVVIRAL